MENDYIIYNKLVRDKIPDIIRKSGREPRVRVAKDAELDYLMRQKIVEEATELLDSGSVEEIADILEIIDALVSLRGLRRDDLETLRKKKIDARGGFNQGLILDLHDLK